MSRVTMQGKAIGEKAARHRAMAYPLRAEVFLILSEEVTSPARISRLLDESVDTVSYHVRKLVELGCAEPVREEMKGSTVEHFYRATQRHLIKTEEWESLPFDVKEHLSTKFAELIADDMLLGLNAGTVGPDKEFHLTRTRLELDQVGLEEAMKVHEHARLRLAEIGKESANRIDVTDRRKTIQVSSCQAFFKVPSD